MTIRIVRLGSPRARGERLRRAFALLAALSHRTELSVGCDCGDERRCHRGIRRELLRDVGGRLT